MKVGVTAAFLGLCVLRAGAPLLAAEGVPRSFQVSTTESVKFSPGGAIRLNGSYGYLSVDGWDEPRVEITVIKSTDRFYEPSQQEEAEQHMGLIHVATERPSETELVINTTRPARHGLRVPPMPRTRTAGVTVEVQMHVPRDSRLAIHHDMGYVWVSGVTGNIEVSSHTGDMIVMLPAPGQYSIDAKTRLGSVTSDYAGSGNKQFLFGTRFAYAGEGQSRQVTLRMGRGSITIKQSPPPWFPGEK